MWTNYFNATCFPLPSTTICTVMGQSFLKDLRHFVTVIHGSGIPWFRFRFQTYAEGLILQFWFQLKVLDSRVLHISDSNEEFCRSSYPLQHYKAPHSSQKWNHSGTNSDSGNGILHHCFVRAMYRMLQLFFSLLSSFWSSCIFISGKDLAPVHQNIGNWQDWQNDKNEC